MRKIEREGFPSGKDAEVAQAFRKSLTSLIRLETHGMADCEGSAVVDSIFQLFKKRGFIEETLTTKGQKRKVALPGRPKWKLVEPLSKTATANRAHLFYPFKYIAHHVSCIAET